MVHDEENFEGAEDYDEFVPAVFSRSREEADVVCELLNDHDIPAMVGTEDQTDEPDRGSEMTHGVPVLVPDVLLDEASEIIADREDAEEFSPAAEEDDDEEEDDDDVDFGFGPENEEDLEAYDALNLDEDEDDDLWGDEDEDEENLEEDDPDF